MPIIIHQQMANLKYYIEEECEAESGLSNKAEIN